MVPQTNIIDFSVPAQSEKMMSPLDTHSAADALVCCHLEFQFSDFASWIAEFF